MTTEHMRLAREINIRLPALLTAAVSHATAEAGSSESRAAEDDFRATLLDIPREVDASAVTFALARLSAQIIQQLSESAGCDANAVIQHVAVTYNATILKES
nr:hypothetical protein [uncultured Microbacterium sp.]